MAVGCLSRTRQAGVGACLLGRQGDSRRRKQGPSCSGPCNHTAEEVVEVDAEQAVAMLHGLLQEARVERHRLQRSRRRKTGGRGGGNKKAGLASAKGGAPRAHTHTCTLTHLPLNRHRDPLKIRSRSARDPVKIRSAAASRRRRASRRSRRSASRSAPEEGLCLPCGGRTPFSLLLRLLH
jgi:hypothetical protein